MPASVYNTKMSTSHHLIFEGAELSGKSFLMSQVYPILESASSSPENFLDGCFWINSDIGVMGGEFGEAMLKKYVEIADILKDRSIMFEKLHLTDMVYRTLSGKSLPDYSHIENVLAELNFKIVLTTFNQQEDLIKVKLADRLSHFPHYENIAREPEYYFRQQELYKEFVKKSRLPHIEINLHTYSAEEIKPLFDWLNISP